MIKFIIRAYNLDEEDIYIQSATLNGKPFNRSSITHEEIVSGGELIFRMGKEPVKTWAYNKSKLCDPWCISASWQR